MNKLNIFFVFLKLVYVQQKYVLFKNRFNNKMEFKCQYCDKEFKRKSVLSRHEKTSKIMIQLNKLPKNL